MLQTPENKESADEPLSGEVSQQASSDQDSQQAGSTRRVVGRRGLLRSGSACGISMIFHAVVLIVLGLFTLEPTIAVMLNSIISPPVDRVKEQELVSVELEEELDPAEEITEQVVSSAPAVGVTGGTVGSMPQVRLSQEIVERFDSDTSLVDVSSPMLQMPSTTRLIAQLPEGALGDPRQIVDNYQQAMDRITQEVMWMLDQSDVMLIWCFDQSESMKNDQQEIRSRINRVYDELGLSEKAKGDHLVTAITSYGQGFIRHTDRPTGNLTVIRRAIDSVPIDLSGKEMMCEAVGASIRIHRQFAKRRQMALVLVTDESGDPLSNNKYLESAVAEAKAAKCPVYVLGRESVFGYPYAYMSWNHPQTGNNHWLQIDRGPETAFVEQLQTNGFHRRHDAFSSGFGPYEQARLAQQTGGIFFMLPSVETNLVRGNADKRRYELEAMYSYQPDLRSRLEQFADRDRFPLRTFLWQVISDLNPYDPDAAKIINMRMTFSRTPQQFVIQARESQAKARIYIEYLSAAQRVMEEAAEFRQQETSPRWQANYDLIYAQIVAYQARIYEYGATLEAFLQQPKVVPLQKPPNLTLVHWDIAGRRETIAGPVSQPYIEKASALFQEVIKNHPGTPWAERAAQELKRGYGVDVRPDYHGPPRRIPAGTPRVPIPKL